MATGAAAVETRTKKLAGLQALKEDLQRYLQPEDYELIKTQLQREIKRRKQEEIELWHRHRDERYRGLLGEDRFLKMYRERQELDELIRNPMTD